MSNQKFVLPDDGSFSIANRAADSLISRCDGSASIVYLYILRNNGCFSEIEAAKALKLSHAEIIRAMGVLAELGLVAGEFSSGCGVSASQTEDSLPKYSISDIKSEMELRSDFSFLVDEMQRRLGRIFSGSDLIILFGIYDYLEMPAQVILLMLTYCIEQCREKYGEGRLPTMRRIEKTAFTWSRLGLKDLESAESYLKNMEYKKSMTSEIKHAFQIHDRELTASEQKYVDSWLDMGFSPAAMEIAYDRTVSQTGKLAWPYMNTIMTSWHNKGLHEPDEIEAGDGRKTKRESRINYQETDSGFDSENLQRIKKMLEKLKND